MYGWEMSSYVNRMRKAVNYVSTVNSEKLFKSLARLEMPGLLQQLLYPALTLRKLPPLVIRPMMFALLDYRLDQFSR